MIIYDIWMCLKVGYAENQVFFRGYHIFREIQTLSRTDIGEFFLVHQQGFLKCQTLESSSLICGQPLQCLVVSNKPFAIVYIYIFFFLRIFICSFHHLSSNSEEAEDTTSKTICEVVVFSFNLFPFYFHLHFAFVFL